MVYSTALRDEVCQDLSSQVRTLIQRHGRDVIDTAKKYFGIDLSIT